MLALVAALTKEGVIGKDNKLPWRIPDEVKWFRALTIGHTVIMGRKTYDSIGKPLSRRQNIVLSRSTKKIPGVDVCATLDDAILRAHDPDIFVIGGAQIFNEALQKADVMFLSYVKGTYEGDAYFPQFDKDQWKVERKEDHSSYELVVYRRVSR